MFVLFVYACFIFRKIGKMSMLLRCLFLIAATAVSLSQGSEMACSSIRVPDWGVVDCDKGTEPGSKCTLSCLQYYDLAGTTESSIEIVCGDDEMWSPSAKFVCNPIRCEPLPQTPENGDRICSANTLAQSLCVVTCDRHFDMKDVTTDRSAYTYCKDDGDGDEVGQWEAVEDLPTPPLDGAICETIKCPFEHKAPENGRMVCSAGSSSGSFCIFLCNDGFDFAGTRKNVINSYCYDDENYDNVGKWSRARIPRCKKTITSCPSTPNYKGIVYQCTSEEYEIGTKCNAVCESSLEELQQGSELLCQKKYQWHTVSDKIPRCTRCKRVKDLQIVAMIHETEDSTYNYNLAVKVITRSITVLRRKYKNPATNLKVNRYSSSVDASAEVFITSYQAKRDRPKISAIPHTGSEENLEKALTYISDSLVDNGVRVAMIFTNGMKSDAQAEKLADDLRKRGVIIIVIILPRDDNGPIGTKADMIKIAGDKARVFEALTAEDAEQVKDKVAKMISDASIRMGCKKP